MKKSTFWQQFLQKYKHAWVFLYGFIYIPWFLYLENRTSIRYHVIHSALDDHIPFVEYFIIPYLLWFVLIASVILYFFFTDKDLFYRLTGFLFLGMTLFLLICTIFPNAVNLRPQVFPRDNMFTDIVQKLYMADTPTNVLPSVHVFNSVGVCIAAHHSPALRRKPPVYFGIYLLSFLIILSTMFLKQHSVIDVVAAIGMACIIYPFVYVTQEKKAVSLYQQLT